MAESVESAAQLELDLRFGGLRAGNSTHISPHVADHFNRSLTSAIDEDEFVPFAPGEYVSIAVPTHALARAKFLRQYRRLSVRVDGELEFRLCEHPHFFSAHPLDATVLRGAPTYIAKSHFPEGSFGRPHTVELFHDGTTLSGAVQRFFHDTTSGAVYARLRDGEGRLVVEVTGKLEALRGTDTPRYIVVDTDPGFGVPQGALQRTEDGTVRPLTYEYVGIDYFGGAVVFNNGVVRGVEPTGDHVVIEVSFPRPGSGFAAARGAGHTMAAACRADATVY